MNEPIHIVYAHIASPVTHCLNSITPPPLPIVRLPNLIPVRPGDPYALHRITDRVSRFYGVSVADIRSRTRRLNVLLPRQIAMFIAHEHTRASFTVIAGHFNRTHNAAMTACKAVRNAMDTEPNRREEVITLTRELLKT